MRSERDGSAGDCFAVTMKVTRLFADDFLSYSHLDLKVPDGVVVVTGPNGSGKSNLLRCLDLASAAVSRAANGAEADRLERYAGAGRGGASVFRVGVGVDLDRGWEREVLAAYVRVAIVSALERSNLGERAFLVDQWVARALNAESVDALNSGTLVVQHRGSMRRPWQVNWLFQVAGRDLVLQVDGAHTNQLFGGAAPGPGDFSPGGKAIPALLGLTPGFDLAKVPEEFQLGDVMPPPGESFNFAAERADGIMPEGHARLGHLLGVDLAERGAGFAAVLERVVGTALVVTDNHRLPLQHQYDHVDLSRRQSLRDGATVPARLFQLYNGDSASRHRFERTARAFEELTGKPLGLRTTMPAAEQDRVIIEPTVMDHGAEVPLAFLGAGVQESLVLATLLNQEAGTVVALDEPAVNLSPTSQRRLWRHMESYDGQVIAVTHSPDLVPAQLLPRVTVARVTQREGSTVRVPDQSVLAQQHLLHQLLRDTDVRALLFAEGVVLCEGDTEVGALSHWWSNPTDVDPEPTPDAANVALLDVGGHNGFRRYTDLLDAFAIPWVIVCDGPALAPEGPLAKQYAKSARLAPADSTQDRVFADSAAAWRNVGVFTFADQYGNDGTKGGEFERYLKRLNPDRAAEVQGSYPKSKVRQGQAFAAEHDCPPGVTSAWRDILATLRSPLLQSEPAAVSQL